jgi:hypothetical protein
MVSELQILKPKSPFEGLRHASGKSAIGIQSLPGGGDLASLAAVAALVAHVKTAFAPRAILFHAIQRCSGCGPTASMLCLG